MSKIQGRKRHKKNAKSRVRSKSDYSRKKGTRKPRERILIVCHGQTEEHYFNHLKQRFKLNDVGVIVKVIARGEVAINVVQRAIKEIERQKESLFSDFDSVWCVCDVEIPKTDKTIPKAVEEINKANKKLNEKTKIYLVLTNPCFEYWFLLHFEQFAGGFNSNKQVVDRLKNHHPDYSKNQNMERIVDMLCDVILEHTEKAINNAERCRKAHNWGSDLTIHNPSTDVDKLVKKLIAISNM